MSDTAVDHVTLHLTPADVWERQQGNATYLPEAFAQDGFIHCTDGEERLVAVGNMFYTGDPRPFLVLDVDLGVTGSPWKYEDPELVFPHIYGSILPEAVLRVRTVLRAPDGIFTGFGDQIS